MAEKWLKNAQTATPNDARVSYQLGQVYRKQGRDEEARKLLTESSEQRSRDTAESQLRVECAQKLDAGPREDARLFCDQLYDPDSAEKLTALGTVYGQHGDPEAALKPLQRAAELAPQSPQMQYNLALAYLNMQDQRGSKEIVDKSRDLFIEILKTQPNDLHARFCLGLYYQHVGNNQAAGSNEQALECFEKVHKADPNDPYVAYKCAETLLALGRSEEGTKMLQRVVTLDPGFVSAVYRLATQYQRSRQQAKAMPLFLLGTLLLLPIVLGYIGFIYWLFRGKVREGESYH